MATTSEASRLQRRVNGMRFTWITVGLLAMLGASACGVGGVDDPEGQQAVYGAQGTPSDTATGQNQQAIVSGPEGCPTRDAMPTVESTGPALPSVSSLPSDPVPWKRPGDDVPLPGPGGMPVPSYGGSR